MANSPTGGNLASPGTAFLPALAAACAFLVARSHCIPLSLAEAAEAAFCSTASLADLASRVASHLSLPPSHPSTTPPRLTALCVSGMGFRAEDGEKGGVFEEIYKEEAASSPALGKAAPAGDDELWTLRVEEEKDDPFAVAVLEEGIEGIGGEDGGLVELDAGEDEGAERQRLENKAREQELTETLTARLEALLFEAKGEWVEAERAYALILGNNPFDQIVHKRKIAIAKARGDMSLAVDYLKKYL